MKLLPKDQHKYKLTTSVDKIPLEILKKKLSETNTPLSSFINKIIIYTSNSNMKPHQLMINK